MMTREKQAEQVVAADLAAIVSAASDELSRLAGARVLLTGGAGFLGYYLVQAIAHFNRTRAAGTPAIQLTVWDNFSRGAPRWLEAVGREADLLVEQRDVTVPLPAELPAYAWIIHGASIASPTYYRQHPIETMDANVMGLRQLLELARRRRTSAEPVRGFLFFSSSEIYGDPEASAIPTAETYPGRVSCTGPRACYDESKRYGETLCVNFARAHGLPVFMARPFNNYGPGLKISDRRVLPDFARDILANKDIHLLSDGSPTRTFCYVADAVVGYLKILTRGRPGEPYNIGVETPEISMTDFAELVASTARELFGYAGRVVKQKAGDGDYLTDNPNRRCPTIAKARSELGYAPAVALAEGVRRTLLWYGGNPTGEDA